MATYIVMYTMTDQGAKNIDSLPQRVKESRAGAEQHGIKVLGWYLTQGQYDVVTVVDSPDEQTLAAGLLTIARTGNFRTETLRAFNEDELERILQKLS